MEFTIEEIQRALDRFNDKQDPIIKFLHERITMPPSITFKPMNEKMTPVEARKWEEQIDDLILDINYFLVSDMMKWVDDHGYKGTRRDLEKLRRDMWDNKYLIAKDMYGIDLGSPYMEVTGSIWADDNVGDLRVKKGTMGTVL